MSEYLRPEIFENDPGFVSAYGELWNIAVGDMAGQDDNRSSGEAGDTVYAYLLEKVNLVSDEFARRLAVKLERELREYEEFWSEYPNQMSSLDVVRTFLQESTA